jgi:hypothetical protein
MDSGSDLIQHCRLGSRLIASPATTDRRAGTTASGARWCRLHGGEDQTYSGGIVGGGQLTRHCRIKYGPGFSQCRQHDYDRARQTIFHHFVSGNINTLTFTTGKTMPSINSSGRAVSVLSKTSIRVLDETTGALLLRPLSYRFDQRCPLLRLPECVTREMSVKHNLRFDRD